MAPGHEAATTAFRARDAAGRLIAPPAWFDLPPEALERLHRQQTFARQVERALDPEGRSATVRAVLGVIGSWSAGLAEAATDPWPPLAVGRIHIAGDHFCP